MAKWYNYLAPYSPLAGSATIYDQLLGEGAMSRRRRKGKIQSSDNIAGLDGAPDYIRNMAEVGRDENGYIKSKAAARGAGFTNKEIATEYADYFKMMEARSYENQLWQERESMQGQVLQAKQAGLNPSLMYGSGASASGGSPQTSDGVSVDGGSQYDEFGGAFSVIESMFGLAQTANELQRGVRQQANEDEQQKNNNKITEANVETAEAQAEAAKANARKSNAEAAGQEFSNSTQSERWDMEQSRFRLEQMQARWDIKLTKKNYEAAEQSIEKSKEELRQMKAKFPLELEKLDAEIDKILSDEDLNRQQIQNLITEEIGLSLKNGELGLSNSLKTFGREYGIEDPDLASMLYYAHNHMTPEVFESYVAGLNQIKINHLGHDIGEQNSLWGYFIDIRRMRNAVSARNRAKKEKPKEPEKPLDAD